MKKENIEQIELEKAAEEIQKLSRTVEQLQGENQSLLDQLKRAVADYRNLETRIEKEKDSFIRYANAAILLKLLPVLDTLEKVTPTVDNQGLHMAVEEFHKLMSSFGIVEIEALGKEFDPNFHESIDLEPGEENKVTTVLEKGYMLGDKVLRAAKVKVGRKQEQQ